MQCIGATQCSGVLSFSKVKPSDLDESRKTHHGESRYDWTCVSEVSEDTQCKSGYDVVEKLSISGQELIPTDF